MSETRPNPFVRLACEVGPLVLFFLANAQFGLFVATGVFMVAMVIALAVNYWMERRVAMMPLVTCGFVLVFGGLTLILQDELFIKIKPTLVNLLFAAALFIALIARRNLLKTLLGSVLILDDTGWRILTWRWAVFFVVLAALNEIVWRNFSTDDWVAFKLFGIVPLTLAFSMAQLPLLRRHGADQGTNDT